MFTFWFTISWIGLIGLITFFFTLSGGEGVGPLFRIGLGGRAGLGKSAGLAGDTFDLIAGEGLGGIGGGVILTTGRAMLAGLAGTGGEAMEACVPRLTLNFGVTAGEVKAPLLGRLQLLRTWKTAGLITFPIGLGLQVSSASNGFRLSSFPLQTKE